MGRKALYNWETLLDEYLRSEFSNKSDFAKSKGINASLFRRNTTNWPVKPNIKSNVTQKRVAKKSNTKSKTKSNVTKKTKLSKIKLEHPEELTENQSLFCLYYMLNPNATQAYMKAYQCSYAVANVSGWKQLVNPRIKAEIDRLKAEKRESIILAEEDLVLKHMRIAFSTMTDFVDFGQIEVPVMGPFGPIKVKETVTNPETGKKTKVEHVVTKIVNDVRFHESSEVDGSVIQEVKVGRDGASIKLYDAQKSMDWLERYFKWNPLDKHKEWFDKEKLKLQQQEIEKGPGNINLNMGVRIVDNIG